MSLSPIPLWNLKCINLAGAWLSMNNLRVLMMEGMLLIAPAVILVQPLDVRVTVDRTQTDLRRAQDFERQHGKEITRYANAQKHLSDFDRDFTRGHFDKGKLNTAIDDLKNVVDHNTLDPQNRDALTADLRDLRVMREEQRN
jgi:hypothetical protein